MEHLVFVIPCSDAEYSSRISQRMRLHFP